MNERIKLLAEQARLYASEQYPGSFVKYDPKWFEFYNEKFAELIVRECMDVVRDINQEYDGGSTVVNAAEEIRDHFGVEE